MVFDEPPAPAARDELGFETVLPVARRLNRRVVQLFQLILCYTRWTYRTAAPGGLATAEAERPGLGESESD